MCFLIPASAVRLVDMSPQCLRAALEAGDRRLTVDVGDQLLAELLVGGGFAGLWSALAAARAREVFDVSGAGDTVIASLALAHASGLSLEAAMEAAQEIGLAVIATSLTLVAVFLPTAFMGGISGKFFKQFGWTASLAVLASLLVARLLTPMMAAYMLKPQNEPNRDGWIMTRYLQAARALGRAAHEGAWVALTRDQRAVVYSGEDARFEYIYKFVSRDPMRPGGAKANRELLDHGTLYVARFDADGTARWLPLVHGQGPLTPENGFADQGEVLIKARQASDALGATKMDRPEWLTIDTQQRWVYCPLTNNSERGLANKPGVDAPNPRANNAMGQIIRWREDGDFDGLSMVWNHLLLAGDPRKYIGGEVDAETAGQRLDNFLLGALKGVPRSHVYRLIRSGQVRVNSGRVRNSVPLLFLVSLVVLVGMWLERFVIVVVSLHRDFLPSSWGYYSPSIVEIFTFFGTFGVFSTLFLLFIRFMPIMPIGARLLAMVCNWSRLPAPFIILVTASSRPVSSCRAAHARRSSTRIKRDCFTSSPPATWRSTML